MKAARFCVSMIVQGLIITVVGMVTVFLFLVLLVAATTVTGNVIRKFAPQQPAVQATPKASAPSKTAAVTKAAPDANAQIAAVIAIAQREFGLSVK